MMIHAVSNWEKKKSEKEDKKERTQLSMGLGWHEIEFEKTKLRLLYQTIGDPVGAGSCVKSYENIIIFAEGKGQQPIIQKFCDHVIALNEKTEDQTFNVYQYNIDYNFWSKIATKFARPLDSVILPEDIKLSLLQDIDEFVSPETFQWYRTHGIPYKRSYLLYGPPGSGKSSVIQAIAGKYKRNLCFVQPLNPAFTDDAFTSCVQCAPQRALIVLEDVDAYFFKDRSSQHKTCPLTFSGLLNGLDGVGSAEGQIFILTTNFIDRLDDALIRSGRVDRKIEFPSVNPFLARQMFLTFYPNDEDHANNFMESLTKLIEGAEKPTLCMADLQQHFITHRKNPAQSASTVLTDITGEEFTLLLEKADKNTKKEDKDKENKEKEKEKTDEKPKSDTSTLQLFAPSGNLVSALSLGLSVGVGMGIAFLGGLLFYKHQFIQYER